MVLSSLLNNLVYIENKTSQYKMDIKMCSCRQSCTGSPTVQQLKCNILRLGLRTPDHSSSCHAGAKQSFEHQMHEH